MSVLWWYHRPEFWGPWIVATCAKHGEAISRFRFAPGAPGMEGQLGDPPHCVFCKGTVTLLELTSCSCEKRPWDCIAHGATRLVN